MELKDVVAPKWVLSTKRGWGMLLTFAGTALPFVNMYANQWFGVHIDAPMISLVGDSVTNLLNDFGTFVGVCLWVYGSFRPTAPLQALPVKAA